MIAKQKLLVLTSSFPRWKGDTAGSFVYELSKRLTRDLDISVLAPNCPGLKTDETVDGIKVHRFRYFFKKYEKLAGGSGILPTLRKNKWYYLQIPFFIAGEFFALRKQIKKQSPDIIHAHWIPQGFVAALIKKVYGVSFVVTAHGTDVFGLRGRFSTALKRFTLKNADRITVVSKALREEILTRIEPKLRIEVISMGVDGERFNPDARDDSIKKKYGIEGPFILFVGRLIKGKGVKYLIGAMPEIIKEFPKAKLLIVGTGALEKELKDLTKELKLEAHIVFTGEIPHYLLPAYYATADIFVGPSIIGKGGDTEGLGLTFVEAALSGCIPVGSNIGGIPDVIKDGITGFLVEQKNPSEISNRVIKLLKDESLADRIRRQARKEIVERFDWEVVSVKYKEVLKGLFRNAYVPEGEINE